MPFDCRVDLLNDFLLEEDDKISNARHHALELLAETYLFEDDAAKKTVAYFSLLNDKVDRDLSDRTVKNFTQLYQADFVGKQDFWLSLFNCGCT